MIESLTCLLRTDGTPSARLQAAAFASTFR